MDEIVQFISPVLSGFKWVDFILPGSQRMKTCRNHGFKCWLREFIASQLFEYKSIVGFIVVEGSNHIIAVFPDAGFCGVPLISVGIRIADKIEPMPGPFFAKCRVA
ncbi:hypothetical protein EBX93_15400 [bacterium]|nr:hypothetical protein [bacterium]